MFINKGGPDVPLYYSRPAEGHTGLLRATLEVVT